MPPRKELCRNFQRGSCQYGERCKFMHAAAQQSKRNPFGFGMGTSSPFQRTNQQQQAPNPFGFGMQNNNQPKGGTDFGSKTNNFKPFENKWTRSSSVNASGGSNSRPSDSQQSAANHKCTDPEACKRVVVEDLEKENPKWKLTCYGHVRDGPCDIVGDISCEELRALAYDDAKHGKSLQSIIERERSLLNSKLVEFQNLVEKPISVSPVATPNSHNLFPGGNANATVINSGPSPPASSFSQLHASLSTGPAAAPKYNFGQSSAFQNNSQPSSTYQMNISSFNTSGAFGSQLPRQSAQGSFPFGSASPSHSAVSAQRNFPFGSASSSPSAVSAQRNPFSTSANTSQMGNVFNKQLNFAPNQPNLASNAFGQSSISTIQLSKEKTNVDDSIWTKAEWKIGEIPEEAPPDICIH